MTIAFRCVWLLVALSFGAAECRAADDPLTEVVVTASLRATPAGKLPQSVTVLQSDTLQQSGVQHFADVLNLVPNLTAAGGTSRPRYFQLRGVGEQEQYQGAPNPSVGFLIDDIDFSGVGMPATLFDVAHIEVLRGPQGSLYGANALAGIINVRTRDAGEVFNGHAEANVGDYGTRSAGVALGGPAGSADMGWRLVAQQYRSDGFRRDAFLNRNDTDGFDEQTLRGKFHWQAGAALRADLTLMHVDMDNGYDAWSIDNSRVTQSDNPGRDSQRSNGGALRLSVNAASFGELRSVSSAADSRIRFSYDGDWGNDAFWARQSACVPDPALCVPYDFTSTTLRHRRTAAEDLRLTGDDDHRIAGRAGWLVGVYALRLTEDNNQLDLYNGAVYRRLSSDYRATNTAMYAQIDVPIATRVALSAALRVEQRHANYHDSDMNAFDPVDRMSGGNLSLTVQQSPTEQLYVTLARGYRAGGFNIGSNIPVTRRQFRPEYLWNLEAGIKQHDHDGRLQWQADVFYMRRVDQQVATSVQTDPSDPLTYQFYTDNAARGENFGAEAQAVWLLAPRWELNGTLGLLRTRYLDFSYKVVAADAGGNPQVVLRDLSGRAQEYSPEQQLSLSAQYRRPSGWFARVDGQYSAGYFFSASHDQRAAARTLMNVRAGLERGGWSVSLWSRNLFNAYYAAHGFYFGNEPPDFANKLYLSAGEPRQIGVTVRHEFAEL
jgi:iron complex outermembrane recepter protein